MGILTSTCQNHRHSTKKSINWKPIRENTAPCLSASSTNLQPAKTSVPWPSFSYSLKRNFEIHSCKSLGIYCSWTTNSLSALKALLKMWNSCGKAFKETNATKTLSYWCVTHRKKDVFQGGPWRFQHTALTTCMAWKVSSLWMSLANRHSCFIARSIDKTIQHVADIRLRQSVPCPINNIHFHTDHLAKYDGIWTTLPIVWTNVNLTAKWHRKFSRSCNEAIGRELGCN